MALDTLDSRIVGLCEAVHEYGMDGVLDQYETDRLWLFCIDLGDAVASARKSLSHAHSVLSPFVPCDATRTRELIGLDCTVVVPD
jgi:hypothetical protein